MNYGNLHEDVRRDPADLEREAADARADVESTLESLEQLLSPSDLLARAVGTIKRNGGEFGRNFMAQVRDNPVPTVLAGLGLAWLFTASDRPARDSHASSGVLRGATADGVRNSAAAMADETRVAARRVRRASMNGARGIREAYLYMRDEQPLLLGALAVATGAAIGALLPRTETEDELLGSASDETAAWLQEKRRQAADAAQAQAAEAAKAAADTVEGAYPTDGQERHP